MIINAEQLYYQLTDLNLNEYTGKITFNLAGISVDIDTTDTVGIILQSWLKKYMQENDIDFHEPINTQAFPDFFLGEQNDFHNMLEVKAFNYDRTPAFDIANFDSYCRSVSRCPHILDADYLIFGYSMDDCGNITIKRIWLHKIWEIAGIAKEDPLKIQKKQGRVYNIRPNTAFKTNQPLPFKSKEDFLNAIYLTINKYRGDRIAEIWKRNFSMRFKQIYGYELYF